MSEEIFRVTRINRKPIPHHRLEERRIFVGEIVLQQGKVSGLGSVKALSQETKIPIPVISALTSGRECRLVTVAVLQSVAQAISCELRLAHEAEECYDGATTTMEELLAMGVVPEFIPIDI
jgi:hypothetical protein